MTERVTVWEEGKAVGLEVAKSDWPIVFMRWVTRIEGNGNGARVVQELEYRLRFGALGWLLDRLVMKRIIDRSVGAALSGFVRCGEEQA